MSLFVRSNSNILNTQLEQAPEKYDKSWEILFGAHFDGFHGYKHCTVSEVPHSFVPCDVRAF